MALTALSIAALAVFHHKPPPSSFLAVSAPKTVGSSRPSAIPASPSRYSGGSRTQLG